MPEDWELLKTFLPGNWRELARETGALKGLRKGPRRSCFGCC